MHNPKGNIKYKVLAVILTLVLMTIGVSACLMERLQIGVYLKNNTAFDIDNVSLEFAYGHCADLNNYPSWPGGHYGYTQLVGYALYFCDGQYYNHYRNETEFPGPYDDYHNIDNQYFVKEFSYNEFNSDQYEITFFLGAHRFNHREILNVPREIFARESGSFVCYIAEISYSPDNNNYCAITLAHEVIQYEYSDQQTVILSVSPSSIPY